MQQLQSTLTLRCWEDPPYRKRLESGPASALEEILPPASTSTIPTLDVEALRAIPRSPLPAEAGSDTGVLLAFWEDVFVAE